jgi:hypothetical protein
MLEQPKQVFVDGINTINFLNGMVRMGIGTLIPATEEGKEPTFSEDYRLIIPLNSFLGGFQSQKDLLEQLESKGIITKQDQKTPESAIIPDVVQ